MWWRGVWLLSAALLGSACSSSAPGPDDSGSSTLPDTRGLPYAPCAADVEVGEFAIELSDEYTSLRGKVWDRVAAQQIPDEVLVAGDCRLLQEPQLACLPACATGEECTGEGECVPGPVARDVGAVSIEGLAIPITLHAVAATKSYRNLAVPALPHPGFAPGAGLHLLAEGGELEPFELWGWGVTALELTSQRIEVRSGMPTRVEWSVPADAGPAHVLVSLSIDNHGGSGAWVECDVLDRGELEIPGGVIDALFERGRTGFPTISVTRRTATSTLIAPGCVELLTTSQRDIGVQVEGITSCATQNDCPEGQTCRTLERYCE